ncbi:MAG: helix-turn-helix transcriptional regulator [Saprospiraceae bacterium]|nr:helix-turn-helix transcriptional regulator [Saprospiraceae bacterium]
MPPPLITCLANTEQNIYFYPRDPVVVYNSIAEEGIAAYHANITGPKNKPVGLKFGGDYLMIKIAFNPTGLYRLLKIPMQKTVNCGLNAADYFHEIDAVSKNLSEETSYSVMVDVVSRFIDAQISDKLTEEEPIDQIATQMLDPLKNYTLPEWASMSYLSLRQFERNFTSRVGITPKMYLRIVRFENAMKIKKQNPEKSWSEIALVCAYNDSSHLLREFRQFADFPPGTLREKQTSGFGDFPTG